MAGFDSDIRQIALDINGLSSTKRGQKVLNAFLASSAEMFQTRRGHLALLVRFDIFEKLRSQLRLELNDGLDGLKTIALAA